MYLHIALAVRHAETLGARIRTNTGWLSVAADTPRGRACGYVNSSKLMTSLRFVGCPASIDSGGHGEAQLLAVRRACRSVSPPVNSLSLPLPLPLSALSCANGTFYYY
jgi:hypothetical protein